MNEKLELKTKKALLITVYLVMSIIITVAILYVKNFDYDLWINYFSFIVIIQFIFQCLIFNKLNFSFFSLTGVFIVLSYLFHFGQLLVIAFFPNYDFVKFNYIINSDSHYIKEAATFTILSILTVGLGIIISNRKIRKSMRVNIPLELNKCKNIGWILVLSTFPIQLIIDINNILISSNQGYLATYQTGRSGIWGAVGFISFIGFGLLILGYSHQKKKSIYLYLFIIIYLLVTMITGHRGHQLTKILFYTYITHKTVYKINFKKAVVLFISIFLGITFLNSITVYRGEVGKSLETFFNIYLLKIKENPLLELITELGATLNTPYLVIQQIPYYKPYAYGLTYVAGLVSMFPNIGGMFTSINHYGNYVLSIEGSALGGSYIGELFYNFSYYGIFFALFIGMLVHVISQKIEYYISQKKYFNISYFISPFIYILWWPRGTFQSIIRPTIWGALIILIVYLYLYRNHLSLNKKSLVN